MTIPQLYEIYLRHPGVRTDTRQLRSGDLFFALKGPNFNGNEFALRALEQGASYAVVDELPPGISSGDLLKSSSQLILVPDTLIALQELALHHRRQFNIPFIAITGSNGKTTTKELIHAVLASTFTTYTTAGNLNNHIGIPLTILSVRKDAQFAVIEMGANHQKEIEGYCRYTLPTHGIITNAGKAHLEGFGGEEGVRKGKGELYDFLRSSGGTAFVCWDYDYLREMSHGIPHIIRYGTRDADITGLVHYPSPVHLSVEIHAGPSVAFIQTQLVGDYNLPNVLVAVAVGTHFGVPAEKIRQAIEQYTPSNSRSQLVQREGQHIILDSYNANPSSMKAAIENFARLPLDSGTNATRKVLILGSMAELGPQSLAEHRSVVQLIDQYPWREVALVGGDFEKIPHAYHSFSNSREAGDWLRQSGLSDAWLLIKGSRSMKMEEVLSAVC
jgi:UDP-N-acetylmuramoyl-tripeptide--D-alanyl-D-alanine ligase